MSVPCSYCTCAAGRAFRRITTLTRVRVGLALACVRTPCTNTLFRPAAAAEHSKKKKRMLFYSYFKTLVGQEVTVELKNDLAITGTAGVWERGRKGGGDARESLD